MPEAVVLPLFMSCACSGMSFLHLGTKIGPFKAFLTTAVICCRVVSDVWAPHCSCAGLWHQETPAALVPALQPGHRLVAPSVGTAPSVPSQPSSGKGKGLSLGFFPLLGCPKLTTLSFGEQPTLRTWRVLCELRFGSAHNINSRYSLRATGQI